MAFTVSYFICIALIAQIIPSKLSFFGLNRSGWTGFWDYYPLNQFYI